MNSKKALLMGCGDLGILTAQLLTEKGFEVTGARRNTQYLPAFVKPLQVDVTNPETLKGIVNEMWSVVVITLTARGEAAYQSVYVDGVRHILEALAINKNKPLILFASSTSVYAQNDGSFVTESSDTLPNSYSGRTMLAAESLVRKSGFPYCAIRFSGIYGRKRGGHLQRVIIDGEICAHRPVRYSNRIHINDCANIFVFLLQQYEADKLEQGIYIGTDGQSVPLREVMEWLAEGEGIAIESLKESYAPNRGGNKRCCNERLSKVGYQFIYSDYKKGYLH